MALCYNIYIKVKERGHQMKIKINEDNYIEIRSSNAGSYRIILVLRSSEFFITGGLSKEDAIYHANQYCERLV